MAVDCNINIPNNIMVRAAEAVLEETKVRGRIGFVSQKRIPIGGGLGGGSSDAAAVLLALPALTGRPIPWLRLVKIGADLGSDVPFYLGGTALGLGRGTELYPLPDAKSPHGILIAPGIHVSTPEAFRTLARPLTWDYASPKISTSQQVASSLLDAIRVASGEWSNFCANDFESAVFRQYPQLGAIKRNRSRFGARPALMSGSESSVHGFVFQTSEAAQRQERYFRRAGFPTRSQPGPVCTPPGRNQLRDT